MNNAVIMKEYSFKTGLFTPEAFAAIDAFLTMTKHYGDTIFSSMEFFYAIDIRRMSIVQSFYGETVIKCYVHPSLSINERESTVKKFFASRIDSLFKQFNAVYDEDSIILRNTSQVLTLRSLGRYANVPVKFLMLWKDMLTDNKKMLETVYSEEYIKKMAGAPFDIVTAELVDACEKELVSLKTKMDNDLIAAHKKRDEAIERLSKECEDICNDIGKKYRESLDRIQQKRSEIVADFLNSAV